MVRDALRGLRRRAGVRQRQAGPLRLGEGIGREAVRGFTLSVLLEACGRDVAGLRDAAILSLGYDAGLRVSELVAVAVELMEAQEDGSGLLEVPHSKTDQEGQGAWVWLSPDTMRRVALWREAASIRAGALFRRVAVIRTKPREARRALAIEDLAYTATTVQVRIRNGRIDAGFAGDFGRHPRGALGVAAIDGDDAALEGQRGRAGAAQPLGGGADDGLAALDSEVHGDSW